MPVRRLAKPTAPKRKIEEEVSLELAIDPRTLIQPIEAEPPSGIPSGAARAPAHAKGTSQASHPGSSAAPMDVALARHDPKGALAAVHDVAFDATLLAEYGDPPTGWVMTPLYAWRVLRRQRELKQALVGRREEATRTSTELDDALVAFAHRVRATAEGHDAYGPMLAEVKRAEEAQRSRDLVLAADQDAQMARLESVDVRLTKLQAELAKAQADERAVSVEMASSQGALSRAEAKLKRAESELRAVQRGRDRTA